MCDVLEWDQAVHRVKNPPPHTPRGKHERDGTTWLTRLEFGDESICEVGGSKGEPGARAQRAKAIAGATGRKRGAGR